MIEVIALTIICMALVAGHIYAMHQKDQSFQREREQWAEEKLQWKQERQQLLDRIQAPTFDHYKQAEIRVIKAQKEEDKPPIQLL